MSFELTQFDLMGMTDDQKKAVVDAMVIAAWADGKVSPAEAQQFEQDLAKIPFGKDQATLQQWVVASRDHVQTLKTREAIEGFFADLARRLPLPHLREKALYHLGAVAYSGGKEGRINSNEKNVIAGVAKAFGIADDRIMLIRNQVMGK